MKFLLKYLFISFFLLCGITFFLLGFTEKGLLLELRYAARFIPGEIKIERVSGTLFSQFSLQHIIYQYQGKHFVIESIQLKWHPSKLFLGYFDIDTLSIKNATIQINSENQTLKNSIDQSNTSIDMSSLRSKFHLLRYIQMKHILLDQFYVHKDKQIFYLNGTLDNDWNFQWSLKSQTASLTNGYLQGEGKLTGPRFKPVIDAVINGNKIAYNNNTIGTFNAEAHIILQPNENSHLKINAANIKIDTYYFKQLTLNTTAIVKYIKNEWVAILQLNANKQFTLDTTFSFPASSQDRVPKFTTKGFFSDYNNQAFKGNFHFTVSDLSILTTLLPDIKNPRGILQGNGIFQGTLNKPELNLALTLNKASFSLPILGIQPTNLNAKGEIDNSFHLTFNGTFQSGIGTAQLKGNYPIGQVNAPLALSIQGNNLQIVNLSEYHVTLSPQISLILAYPSLKVDGNVVISEASMKPKNTNTAVTLPDEVIFINQQKAITPIASPIQLALQLGVQLGDKVNVDYANLQAKLLGRITVSKTPDGPPQATGELYTAQGKYTAYGQKLIIERGRLIYTGNPLTNPGLDIRAVKKIKRVITQSANGFTTESSFQNISYDTELSTVGVQVLGTAERPKITLFSTPGDLSQADILSYLILGVPQSQASAAQGSILFAALSAYNPDAQNALGFTNTLQKSLGLNELSISSVETFNPNTQAVESNTAFVVGKQITQKLSIHYSIGLFNPISILNLRYRISQHWTLQSETSSIDSGADILYGFERD